MKKTYILPLLCGLSIIAHSVNAQVTGTKIIGVDYSTLAAAVTALNTTGISGSVVISVPAGYTETAPAGGYLLGSAVLNASTSSSGTLTFQKSGTGANPLLTAPVGTSASTDGIFTIQGTDYVTINGIDLTESAGNTTATTQMEWGYGLVKRQASTPFDGCQNVTIQNCTVTLNKNNAASVGIYSGCHIAGSTTALTITSTADATNNCNFSGNTITNVNRCVSLTGLLTATTPYTLYDQNNTVGGTTSGSGNQLTNFGGTATAGYGIYLAAQNNAFAGYNTITSATTPGTASIYGIFHGIGTNSNLTVSNNTFQLTLGASGSIYGIANGTGTAGTGISGTTGSIIVSQNIFQNYSFTAANSATHYLGLYNYVGGSTSAGWDLGSLKMLGNVVQNSNLNTTGTVYSFYNIYCNANDVRFNDNKMYNLRRPSTSGSTYFYYNYYGNPTGGADSAMRNRMSNCSAPANLYGVYSFGTTVVARNKVYMYDTITYDTCGLSVSSSLLDCVYAYSGNNNTVANNYCVYNYGNPTNSSTIYGPRAASGTNHTVRDNIYTHNISYSQYCIYAISSSGTSDVYNNIATNNTSSTGTTYGLYCLGSGTENVYNNTVANNNATGAGSNYGIYHTSSVLSTIHDNTFYNLSSTGALVYGIFLSSGTASNVYNNTIGKLVNTGTAGGNVAGLYCTQGGTVNFYDNVVDTVTTAYSSGTAYGVYESGPATFNCYRNKISYIASLGASGSVNGIYLNSGTTNAYNNLVGNLQLTTSSSVSGTNLVGIYCGTGDVTNGHTLSYNTVVLNATTTGTAYSSSALFSNTTYPLKLRNNIFINNSQQLGTGTVAAYRRNSTTIASYSGQSNNNLFYAGTPGTSNAILFDGTTNYSTLPTYQAAVASADVNSVAENTTFQSLTGIGTNFLRPSLTASTQIESSGVNISGITNDVYQVTRAGNTGYSGSGAAPDLGAVEDNYTLADLSAPTLVYTPFSFTCSTGDRTFTATISDLSGVASGSLSPRVYFKKGSGSWYSAPGTLSSGTTTSGTWTFTIAAATMGGLTTGDVISYYVLSQDVATTPNVGSVPVGVVAANVNSVTTHPATPNTYAITSTLSGTFSVGAGQTYSTITDAVNAYNTSCLSGPVIFQLTDATYPGETFPITINNNTFASSTATLTIKPATGISPTITGSSTSIFKLNGADYVIIDGSNAGSTSRNLTIVNTNTATSATAVIWIASTGASDGATNNTIKNCVISGNSSTTTEMCIFSGAASSTGAFSSTAWLPLTPNSNNVIQNNGFMKSQYGVWLKGTSTTNLDQSSKVQNNAFGTTTTGEGFNAGGVVMQFQNNPVVSGNDIQNVQGTGGVSNVAGNSTVLTGVYIRQCTNAQVSANKIHGLSLSAANRVHVLYMESPAFNTASSPSNNLIVNNAVYDARITSTSSTTWTVSGISANGGYGDKFYYNTVNLTGVVNAANGPAAAFSNGNALTQVVTSNIDVRNNVFIINGSSTGTTATFYATYWYTAASVTSSVTDYNDLYSAISSGGTANVGFNGSASSTFSAWQMASAQEVHSINVNPLFVSATDLHLQALTANAPLAAGTPITGVTTDLFGTARSSTTPVMGVHEVSFSTVPPTITYSTLNGACGWTNRTVTATIGDASTGVPTTGSLVPRVYYRKNSGTWYSQPGTLTSGSGTSGIWSFTIVAADMGTGVVGDVVSYYIAAQTNAGITGASPSSGFAATDVNTITTPPTTPNTYGVLPSLSGSYNVGTSGAYTTITSAVSAYNSSCLAGPVTFLLTDATYPGETFPIAINTNSYASSSANLTIKPASGISPVISGTSSTAIFKLNGSDFVTIDGSNTVGGATRNLTISNTGSTTTGNMVVWIAGVSASDAATNNTIKNCTISGNSSTTTEACVFSGSGTGTGTIGTGYNPATSNANNLLQNNSFMKAQYGVWFKGPSTSLLDQGNQIIGNDFGTATAGEGFNGAGLMMQLQNNAVIANNKVQNVQGTGGITNLSSVTIFSGIYMKQCTNGFASANKVFNINYNSPSGTNKPHAFYVEAPAFATAGNPSNNTIVNNAIYDIRETSAGTTSWSMSGLSANGGYGDKFYYNTVNLTGVISVAAGPVAAFSNGNAGTTTQTSNITLKNNIFNVNGSSTSSTANFYAIYWQTSTPLAASATNYNDLRCVSTGGAAANTGFDGFSRASIVDWRSATSQDANSISVDPVFVAPNDIHLQIVPANLPFISGTPIPGITTDLFDTLRSTTTPVIGAHEVKIPPCSTPVAGTVTTTPSSGCVVFTSNLATTGTTTGVYGLTYQWQSSPDGIAPYTDIAGATNLTHTASVTATRFYRAVVGCSITTLSSTTPGVQVISNPNPDPITGTTAICVTGSLSLSSTTSGGTWTSGAPGIATIDPSTGILTGITAGTAIISYTIPATGCRATTIATVAPTPSPYSVSPNASEVCVNGSAQLLTASNTTVTNSGTVGTQQNINTTITYPAPLSMYYGAQRCQVLVLASELAAMGFVAGSNITAMDLQALTLGSAYTLNSFQVRIAPTAVTALSSFITTGLVTVKSAANYSPVVGNNSFAFTTPFVWNGTSNLVFDLTFGNSLIGSTTTSATQYNTNTSFVSTLVYRLNSTSAATAAAATTVTFYFSQRPDFTLSGTNPVIPTWAPVASLYTDAAATIPYTGTATSTVYALPSSTTTYTTTATNLVCATTANATVTVNPMPVAITGGTAVCHGLTSTLVNTDGGGTWSSANTAVATIDATTGLMTGITTGTTLASYTFTTTGCIRTGIVTVNALPATIDGIATVCQAATTTLSNTDAGGTWSSGTTPIATVGVSSGAVSGVAAGLSIITYMLPTGCINTKEVTVNPLPVVNITPATSTTICEGESTSVTASAPLMEFSLLDQNFNSGLGTWVISTPVNPADGLSPWSLTSTSAMSIAGDGTAMIEAAPSASVAGGLTETYLTSPSFSTVGFGSANLTFNEHLYSTSASDLNIKVQYSIDGGSTWNTLSDQYPTVFDTTVGSGSWVATSPEVTIPLPTAALNVPNVKLRWFYETNWGGWWEIDNIAVKAALPAATFAWAGIGTADGLSCTSCATPTITPTLPGTNVYNVTASSTCSTTRSVTVNVNPLPDITGIASLLCTGSTITLGTTIPGGTWVSGNNAVATVDAMTGAVTGVTAGSVVISYTSPTTCVKAVTLNVNQTPVPVGGVLHVCETLTTTLVNAIGGGTWSSANTAIATIDAASGITTGILAGTSTISYIMPTGCFVIAEATVDPLPAITGAASLLCTGSTITLGNTIAGGTWVSSNNTIATVDASGVVTGMAAGSVIISYTLPTTCGTSVTLNVNQTPGPITGSLHICEGLTTALGNTILGGSWSSSDLGVAAIDITSGLATAVAAGTSTISYIMPSGCQVTDVTTVDLAPTAFTGSLSVCESSTTTLGTTPTGGTWVSGAPSIATVNITTGIVSGVAFGTANIVYTSSTGCQRTEVATVNALPVDISGPVQVCEGLTTTLINTTGGGTWSSSNMTVATIDAGGVATGNAYGTTLVSYTITATGCYKTTGVTVNALPGAIAAPVTVCEGLSISLSNTPAGGTWTSNSPAVATIDMTTGLMTGIAFGTADITYTLPTGCISSTQATVNPLPVATIGLMQVCQGLTTNLTNTTSGGTWSSDDFLVAGVDATGMVTGNTLGTANIIYTLPTGCLNSVTVTVNQLPGAIGGTLAICEGLTSGLTNTVSDGVWSSSAPTTAGIDPLTGVLTGIAAGNATITYTLLTGCRTFVDATVNALPALITGTMDMCKGSTTTLFSTPGGTWSNDLSGNATVAATGIVSGVVDGTTSITYTLGTGCMRAAEVTVNALPTIYTVTGGGGYCAGTSGAVVGLGNSDLNVNYDLFQGSTLMGSAIGTGSAISFGSQSVVGTYTVFATNVVTNCAANMTGSAVITITPLNIPAVALNTTATTVCSGVAVTYTAIPVNGGTLPVYNWQINGMPVLGATSATYSYNPANGDIVKVTLNSNGICATPSTATDLLTMTVNTSELPVATISVPMTTICAGSGATFSVVPAFGGTAPAYEWFVNGTTTGATSSAYTYAPANGDVVTCKMASNFTCRLFDTVISNSLAITTTPIALPIISLGVTPGAVFNYGTPVTFSATVTGVGTATPTYQWIVNNTIQAGITGATFTSSTLNNNDSVTCKVSVLTTCGFENFNSIVVKVKKVGVSEVFGAGNITLAPNPNQGEFTIKGTVASETDEDVFVEVVDMLGQIVFKGHTVTRSGTLSERIKLTKALANGMYMLNVRTATESAVFHFVLEQ